MSFFVYLLECTDKSTYVGATVDLEHRLRQHNKEIKGGAHATSMKVGQGHAWNFACYITGFPDWRSALQFEWAFKFYSRKYAKQNVRMHPLERRMRGLIDLLNLDRSTSKAELYSTYPEGLPKIVWKSEEAQRIYESITEKYESNINGL
jgi:predicted GIY-YIG superfamily endonuclease